MKIKIKISVLAIVLIELFVSPVKCVYYCESNVAAVSLAAELRG